MKIGELAEISGTTPRQLRYYESRGLIESGRSGNGYRDYPADSVDRVRQIRCLLDSGFSTELIARLLPCVQGPEAELPAGDDPELERELRLRMTQMREQIEMLRHTHERFECYLRRVDGSENQSENHTAGHSSRRSA